MTFVIADFKKLDRVEISPATDAWMMGDRFGEITQIGRKRLRVKFDRSGRIRFLGPENIARIIQPEGDIWA